MNFVDLTVALSARAPLGGWTGKSAPLTSSNLDVAESSSGTWLTVYGFEKGLPEGASLTGLQVFATMAGDGSSSLAQLQLTHDRGDTGWGDLLTTGVLPVSGTALTFGASGDLLGTNAEVGQIENNPDFGIRIRSSVSFVKLYSVRIRVWYTPGSVDYLTGYRSTFPLVIDDIQEVTNGTSATQEVRSEAVNRLGDCLYNIERVSLHQGNPLRAYGAPEGREMYAFSITVSGSVESNYWAAEPKIHWEQAYYRSNGTTYANQVAQSGNVIDGLGETDLIRTQPMWATAEFNFVGAMGWIARGSEVEPLSVSPRALMTIEDTQRQGFYFGFSAMSVFGEELNQPHYYTGYAGLHFRAPRLSPGAFVVKMLAIGELSPTIGGPY